MQQYVELNKTIVIEKKYLSSLEPDDLAKKMQETYSSGKEVIFVESTRDLFSNSAIVRSIETGDAKLPLQLEYRGIALDTHDMETIERFLKLKSYIADALIPSINGVKYPFAEVPDDWAVEDTFTFTHNSIQRNGHTLGRKTFAMIWDIAFKYWMGISEKDTITSVRASGYTRDVYIHDNDIKIGCQVIPRYEVEQLAVELGLPFVTSTE